MWRLRALSASAGGSSQRAFLKLRRERIHVRGSLKLTDFVVRPAVERTFDGVVRSAGTMMRLLMRVIALICALTTRPVSTHRRKPIVRIDAASVCVKARMCGRSAL